MLRADACWFTVFFRSWRQMNVYKGREYAGLLHPLWLLRARMAFVVDNLQSYLQVNWDHYSALFA